jgi:hypothetical protein
MAPTLSEQLEAQTLRLIAHLDEMDKRAAARTKAELETLDQIIAMLDAVVTRRAA